MFTDIRVSHRGTNSGIESQGNSNLVCDNLQFSEESPSVTDTRKSEVIMTRAPESSHPWPSFPTSTWKIWAQAIGKWTICNFTFISFSVRLLKSGAAVGDEPFTPLSSLKVPSMSGTTSHFSQVSLCFSSPGGVPFAQPDGSAGSPRPGAVHVCPDPLVTRRETNWLPTAGLFCGHHSSKLSCFQAVVRGSSGGKRWAVYMHMYYERFFGCRLLVKIEGLNWYTPK